MNEKMDRMVRKQVNIEREQDEAVKRIAAENGQSESEVVREAIDRFVDERKRARASRQHSDAILDELFAAWDERAFDREQLASEPETAYRFGAYGDPLADR
jgi:hypothetical protein